MHRDAVGNGSRRPRMKLTPARLAALRADALPRVVYVFGDEPLQRQEAEDRVRSLARAAGAAERVVHSVNQGFDWAALTESSQALSLFSERRVIDLRMPSPSPGQDGGRVQVVIRRGPAGRCERRLQARPQARRGGQFLGRAHALPSVSPAGGGRVASKPSVRGSNS